MEITLECPRCSSTVSVRSGSRGKRQVGTCAGCGSVFSFYAGTLTYIDPTRRRWRPSSWRFRDLVEAERQRMLAQPLDTTPDPEDPPEAPSGA
ncbi:hypothetical protein [Aquihabitans sp. McL0605]|uniref:hypothetical protein n=1 Tax=Aquihabitans sp. McL0605 TaxID=3415671 RepID=UPI003CEE84C6